MDDVAKATKIQQDSDASVIECLTSEINLKAERSLHVLTALHAAAIPLDSLTAEVLHDLGNNMAALIQLACSDHD